MPTKLALTLIIAGTAVAQSPDLILRNGHIYTGTPATPWVEALSISGEHITAIGNDATVTPTADQHTQIVDLHGAMAMPGINDSHNHVGGSPFGVEAHTKRPPQADPSIAEVAEAVHGAALAAKPGDWITAYVGPAIIHHPKETRTAMD